jgi:hypothetical protein
MNANHDLERRIADFYETEAPLRAPDWVLESALATVDTTKQRRALIRVPWRFTNMNTFAKVAVAAVAVIAVGGLGLAVLRPGTGPGPGASNPSTSTSSSPSASPLPSSALPALAETFTSERTGISISHPTGWTIVAATEPWSSGLPATCDSPCADRIYESETDSPFIGLSSQPLAGRTGEQWAAEVVSDPGWGGSCDPQTEPASIDGAPAMIAVQCPDPNPLLTALAWTADRGYLIVLYRIDDRAYFDQLLATVQFHPEDAVDAAPSASPAGS